MIVANANFDKCCECGKITCSNIIVVNFYKDVEFEVNLNEL